MYRSQGLASKMMQPRHLNIFARGMYCIILRTSLHVEERTLARTPNHTRGVTVANEPFLILFRRLSYCCDRSAAYSLQSVVRVKPMRMLTRSKVTALPTRATSPRMKLCPGWMLTW